MQVSVRQFQDQDFSDVLGLMSMKVPAGYHGAVFIRQAHALFPATFLVAERAGAVIGFAIGAFGQEDPGTAWVLRIAVHEASRRQQAGHRLLSALLDLFRSRQVRRVLLSVSPEAVPAISLYTKHGFYRMENRENYFGDGEPRIIMQLDL